MSQLSTELLAELIRRKRDCLWQLREMGVKQMELIRQGEMNELLDVLAAKQRQVFELQRAERALTPFHREDPESRRWKSPAERSRCAADLAECERLLAEIVEQERQSETELVRRRDEAARRLRGISAAGAACGAYAAGGRQDVNQIDLSSHG